MIKEKPLNKNSYILKLIELSFDNKTYIVEINIIKKKIIAADRYQLNTFWTPAYRGFSWYDCDICSQTKQLYLTAKQDLPSEFIDYCNKYLEKYFKLKAFM